MIKANSLNKGNIVEINGQPHQVRDIEIHTPSARGANTLYKFRFDNMISGQKLDATHKGSDAFEELEMERRPVTWLYQDGNMQVFMDGENYEQYFLAEENLEGKLHWLIEGLEGMTAMLMDGQIMTIEVPATVDLEIVETAPGLKGASATNRTKPAELSNGITVQVPEYLAPGEIIRVNTDSGKYMSRVKQ